MKTSCVFSLVVVLSLIAGGAAPDPAAAEEAQGANLALHAGPGPAKSPCATLPADSQDNPLHCLDYRTTWPLGTPAEVYLVVVGMSAGSEAGVGTLAEVSLGIDYDPWLLAPMAWALCADWQTTLTGPNGDWPAPMSGNRIYWGPVTNCQDTPVFGGHYCWGDLWNLHALAGSFYVVAYGDDALQATINMAANPEECYYTDCDGVRYDFGIYVNSAIGFGAAEGAPCQNHPVPVEKTSWGGLKALY